MYGRIQVLEKGRRMKSIKTSRRMKSIKTRIETQQRLNYSSSPHSRRMKSIKTRIETIPWLIHHQRVLQSKKVIHQNKDWNRSSIFRNTQPWQVQKGDPSKQGLKLMNATSTYNLNQVQKGDPSKQGLKHAIKVNYCFVIFVQKGDPSKQGLKLMPSLLKRLEDTSKKVIHQNKDWN